MDIETETNEIKKEPFTTWAEVATFTKWLIGAAVGLGVAWIALSYSPMFYSKSDPYALYRWTCQTTTAMVLFILGLSGGLIYIDWYTRGEWFQDIRNGNWNITAFSISYVFVLAYLLGGFNRI